jgi:hypothetical protein
MADLLRIASQLPDSDYGIKGRKEPAGLGLGPFPGADRSEIR